MMNREWVEKQAAKKAALEAAEKTQTEQRAAMEAASAAGVAYKRSRGRPLGSKSKPRSDADLPPPENAQVGWGGRGAGPGRAVRPLCRR